MARIAIGGFLHETNCFVPMRTDYDYYARGGEMPPLARGAEILERTRGSSFGMSGFLEVMESRHDLVPLIWGHAGAGGYVTDDAFERIVGELVGGLSQAMPVDAVYLDLHGAMCSETFEDAEGELLRRVRACIGADVPLVITLDYHANIGQATAELTDGMAIYLTYPHVDRQAALARDPRGSSNKYWSAGSHPTGPSTASRFSYRSTFNAPWCNLRKRWSTLQSRPKVAISRT